MILGFDMSQFAVALPRLIPVSVLCILLAGCSHKTDLGEDLPADRGQGESSLSNNDEPRQNPATQFEAPNIIFVVADDLGYGSVACYGNQVVNTPELDRMAAEGIRFTNAYAGSPVCAPSRCILMTGRHAGHCSVRVNTGGVPLPDADITIAEMLKTAGYKTGGFGKWGLGIQGSTGDPQRQGFDEFFGYYHQTHAHNHFPEYLVHNGKRVKLAGNVGAGMAADNEGFVRPINTSTGEELVYAPYEIFEKAKDFIVRNRDERFFCYLPTTLPHGRFQVPDSDPSVAKYKDRDWSVRAKVVATMTSILDRQMGDLFHLVSELGIDDKTIVFFCSDHGAAIRFDGEIDAVGRYKGLKRSMYEGGIRIPFIVRWPEHIESGRTSNLPFYLGDMFATLRDIGIPDRNLSADKNLDSISLTPTLLANGELQRRHEIFVWEWAVFNPRVEQWSSRMQSLRQGNWKILRNSEDEPWEFYDLGADPYEQNDLANEKPIHAAELYDIFKREVDPPSPQKEALKNWSGEFYFENELEIAR